MTIDQVLKAIRAKLNYSQEQLASELNISYTTINRWENGKSTPSPLARMRLSEYCAKKGISKEIIAEIDHA